MLTAGLVYRRGQRRSGPSATVAGDAAVAGEAGPAMAPPGATEPGA
jgi:hypothetical protein